jgi:GNAT superfamily N-acetyltransferase
MKMTNNFYLKEITESEKELFYDIFKKEILEREGKSEIQPNPNRPKTTRENYFFYMNDCLVGTIQIAYLDAIRAVFRAIIIIGEYKNQGYGTLLLKQAEELLKKKGYKQILLHSHPRAYSFYARNGYKEIAPFKDNSNFPDSIDMGKNL